MIPDTGPAQVWGLWQFVLSDYGFMLHQVSWMSKGPGTLRCFDTILHLESFRLRSLSVEFFIRSKQTSGTRPWGKRKMICGTMWNEQYRHAWTCYWNVQHDGGSESPRLYLHTLLSNWSSWIINIQKLKTMSIVFLPNSWHNSRQMIFWTDLVHTRLAQWVFYCGVKGSQVIPLLQKLPRTWNCRVHWFWALPHFWRIKETQSVHRQCQVLADWQTLCEPNVSHKAVLLEPFKM